MCHPRAQAELVEVVLDVDEAGHRVATQYLLSVIDGDMPAEKLLPSLEKWFGTHKAEVPPAEASSADFKLFTEQRAFVITDPELGGCEVSLINIEPGRPPTTTEALYRTDLIEQVASWIVNRRLVHFRERRFRWI